MILQQLTDEELNELDQMARTDPGYQVLIDYLLRCINTGALSACYSGGEEKLKLSGGVIAFRDLVTMLLNARASRDEVSRAIAEANLMAGRDTITP